MLTAGAARTQLRDLNVCANKKLGCQVLEFELIHFGSVTLCSLLCQVGRPVILKQVAVVAFAMKRKTPVVLFQHRGAGECFMTATTLVGSILELFGDKQCSREAGRIHIWMFAFVGCRFPFAM